MIKRTLGSAIKAIPIILSLSIHSAGSSDFSPSDADIFLDRCREAFSDVVINPGATGGWFFERIENVTVLCLYGSLENVDIDELSKPDEVIDIAVVRSSGGPVEIWLKIAEIFENKIATGLIDEACFSSCANYFSILPQQLVARPNSLLVWHGGSTERGYDLGAAGASTISQLLEYYDLAARTETLYRRAGINVEILNDTSRPPDSSKLELLNSMGLGEAAIAGYALAPWRLKECYGYRNFEAFWHAGSDIDVVKLSRKRSEGLVVLESSGPTQSDFEEKKCG